LSKAGGQVLRYGVAVVSVAAALFIKLFFFSDIAPDAPFVLFFGAVMVSAWYGGLGPGLLATVLSALAVDYYFLAPRYVFFFSSTWHENMPLLIFVLEGGLISLLAERLRVVWRWSEERGERLRLLIDGTKDYAFIMLDVEGNVATWNDSAFRILGYQAKDIIGRNYSHFYPDEDERPPSPPKEISAVETAGRLEAERWLSRKDGSWFWANVLMTALRDKAGQPRGFSLVIRDISERRWAEKELEKYRQHLEDMVKLRTDQLARSNHDLEQFAYVASHDLQEPLRMISGYMQLLERRYKSKLDSDADKFINFAVDGAARMQQLINDLLAYSRVNQKGDDLTTVDCGEALKEALSNLQLAVRESGAKVTHDPLPRVPGDRLQLVQLFQNLVSNSIKYHGQEPPMIHIGAVMEENGQWRFSVRDNGIGIEPDYFDRIFVIFQRLHDRSQYAGTGIGLAICKRIVERHGGRILVESQVGKGSTFYFTLTGEPS
jgi:PAS domain S-box-containing protein